MFRHQQYRRPDAQRFGSRRGHRQHDERFREVSVMLRNAAVAYGEPRLRIGVKEHVIADPHRLEPELLAFAREVSGVRRGVIDTLVDHRNANLHICSSLGNLHRCREQVLGSIDTVVIIESLSTTIRRRIRWQTSTSISEAERLSMGHGSLAIEATSGSGTAESPSLVAARRVPPARRSMLTVSSSVLDSSISTHITTPRFAGIRGAPTPDGTA